MHQMKSMIVYFYEERSVYNGVQRAADPAEVCPRYTFTVGYSGHL